MLDHLADAPGRTAFALWPYVYVPSLPTPMSILFAVALPIFFFMLTWVLVTAYRILFPEEPAPIEDDPLYLRQRATEAGVSVPVGAREIREDQRRYQRAQQVAYDYAGTPTLIGVPEVWQENLWLRRN